MQKQSPLGFYFKKVFLKSSYIVFTEKCLCQSFSSDKTTSFKPAIY